MPRGFVHRRFLHYYLLAATGACIGFAINKTDEAVASWQQIPWGVAVICWALSLYFGSRILIKETEYMAHVARVDMALNGDDPNVQPDPQVTQQLLQWAQQKGRWKQWQFTLLLAGAVFFIIWHVLEMYMRAADST